VKTITLVILNLVLAVPPLLAASYRSVAKTLAKAADRAGVERVAVLPFSPMDGSQPREGRIIAERLAARIAQRGGVQVVERGRLSDLISEHLLAKTGAVDPRRAVKLGNLLQARAVIVGTFVTLGNELELNARLVDLESGAVLAVRVAETGRDWFAFSEDVIPAAAPFSLEDAVGDVLYFQKGERLPARPSAHRSRERESVFEVPGDLRDAPGAGGCAAHAERVNALQRSVLELKARHWAITMRKDGLDFAATRRRTEAGITDPELRQRYADFLRDAWIWGAKPLSPGEVKRFVEADSAAFSLRAACEGQVASASLFGGGVSLFWPLLLLPLYTTGLSHPDITFSVGLLQAALLASLSVDAPFVECGVKIAFLIVAAWTIRRAALRERSALEAARNRRESLEAALRRLASKLPPKRVEDPSLREALALDADRLTVVLAAAQLLREAIAPDDPAREDADRVLEAAREAARSVRFLLVRELAKPRQGSGVRLS